MPIWTIYHSMKGQGAGSQTSTNYLKNTRLEQTIGYEINIWRDEELTGNEIFAAEIDSQLPELKVMVSIITPRYLSSNGADMNSAPFIRLQLIMGTLSIENKSRIFKIIKTPVDQDEIEHLPEDIHKIFDEILDYKFYIQDPSTGKFKELSRDDWVDHTIRQEYMNKMDDVVQDMANLIKKLTDVVAIEKTKKKIYLAETSYDLETYRDNVARELQEGGFIILPDRNLPNVVNKYSAGVENYSIKVSYQCILSAQPTMLLNRKAPINQRSYCKMNWQPGKVKVII